MIGTPEYMAPEQAEGKPADPRADIYAFGVILYEMVAGKRPFDGDTPLSVAMKHKTEIPRPPREWNAQVPAGLNALILKCLEKDRTKDIRPPPSSRRNWPGSKALCPGRANIRAPAGPGLSPLGASAG